MNKNRSIFRAGSEDRIPWWEWALLVVIPFSLLVGWLLARRRVRPLKLIEITGGSYHRVYIDDTPVENIVPVVTEIPLAESEGAERQVDLSGTPATPPRPSSVNLETADDLTVLEGIGPKISNVLKSAGITTFQKLSETDVPKLVEILRAAGLRLNDPATWPEQATLAAKGDWQGLSGLQATLKGGRKTNS